MNELKTMKYTVLTLVTILNLYFQIQIQISLFNIFHIYIYIDKAHE